MTDKEKKKYCNIHGIIDTQIYNK